MTLFLLGINVHAAEKKDTISSLKDSVEQLIKNEKPEDVKKVFDFISEKIDEGKWKSTAGIKEIIAEGEKEFDVTLTKGQEDKIISVINKIRKLGISPEYLLEQIEELYNVRSFFKRILKN